MPFHKGGEGGEGKGESTRVFTEEEDREEKLCRKTLYRNLISLRGRGGGGEGGGGGGGGGGFGGGFLGGGGGGVVLEELWGGVGGSFLGWFGEG